MMVMTAIEFGLIALDTFDLLQIELQGPQGEHQAEKTIAGLYIGSMLCDSFPKILHAVDRHRLDTAL